METDTLTGDSIRSIGPRESGPVNIARIDSGVTISGEIPEDILQGVRAKNPDFKVSGPRLVNQSRWIEPWELVPSGFRFKRASGIRVIKAMRAAGIRISVLDTRVSAPVSWPELRRGIILRPTQETAVRRVSRARSGLAILPTGSGKTLTGLASAASAGECTLVIVPSIILAKQWIDAASDFYGLSGDDLGKAFGGQFSVGRVLTVGLPGTLLEPSRMEFLRGRIGMVIADEVQRAAAMQYHDCIDSLPALYRIGVSADPDRMDRHEHRIRALFGQTIIRRERVHSERSGAILGVDLRVIRYSAPGNFTRDVSARERRLMADPERMRFLDRIIRAAPGPTIVFARTVEVVRELARRWDSQGLSPGIMIGQANGRDARAGFVAARQGIASGTTRLVVATYAALSVGVDIPALEDAVLASPPGKAERGYLAFNQTRGRVARTSTGKELGRVWLLWDVRQTPSLAEVIASWNDGRASIPVNDSWDEFREAGLLDLAP